MRSRLEESTGRWLSIEEFARDSEAWRPEVGEKVRELSHWFDLLHEEVTGCTAPDGFIDHLHQDLSIDLLPIAVASSLVTSRCERLAICEQLVWSWERGIASRDLSVAALCARALIELAADTFSSHKALEDTFEDLLRRGALAQDLARPDGELISALTEMRYAGRLDEELWGSPRKRNILNAIDRLGPRVRAVYDELSEICHPNSQASAQYWRAGSRQADGVLFVPITPAGGGSSPIKISVMNGPPFGVLTVVSMSRSFWRMAVVISLELGLWRSPYAVRCGLPGPSGRNEACVCGSGAKSKSCTHPNPATVPVPNSVVPPS